MSTRQTALRWTVAVAIVLAVSGLALRRYSPPLPNPLTVDLVVARAEPGKSEPLITSGRSQAGDFLFVRYLDGDFVSLGYEAWGEPGRLSAPMQLPADHRLRLQIEMPALTAIRGVLAPRSEHLRVKANGVELFNVPVSFHVRFPTEIYFGINPIGGTACDAALRGRLFLPDGSELRGAPSPLLTWRHRIFGWLFISRWQAVCALLAGLVTFVFWQPLGNEFRELRALVTGGPNTFAANRYGGQLARLLWRHRWFIVTAAACTLAFTWMVSYGTFKLVYAERFGNFYDYQAETILHGRLDVPDEAISDEAFIVDGRRYGYFGVTPALLRMPFVIFGVFFGELSRAFMVLYFAVSLVACYLILRVVIQFSGRTDDPPSPWATVCFIGGAGVGSTLYYLASRAYIYHEAILCGVMFALLGGWCALRHFAEPEKRWWVGSLLCGILSVHARPPTGFFALTLLAAIALAVMVQRKREPRVMLRREILIGALCGVGVFTFNIVSYLKFKTFEGCPLRFNVQYDATRLARIDGKQFHLVNLPIAVDSYLVHPNFRLESHFPFFFIGARTPARECAKTKIDYHDRVLAFPYAMPGLFALATFGGIASFVRLPTMRLLIATTWAAGVPMSLAMFTAIAITHRYTADFCPFLLIAAAFGVVGIESLPDFWRGGSRAVILAATMCGVLITFAITLHYQGFEVWGVPDDVRENYLALGRKVDDFLRALRR
jgi:hypothetical protein